MARWWNRQTRGPQKAVPTGREGSTPSLVTDRSALRAGWCLWCNWQACDPMKVETAGSTPPEHPDGGCCPVLRLQALTVRRPVGQFDSGMGYCLGCLADRVLGLRNPVSRFDSCT